MEETTVKGTYLTNLNKKDSDWKVNKVIIKNENLPDSISSTLTSYGKNKYLITITGYKLPSDDSEYEYTGSWDKTKYGWQFKAGYYFESKPVTKQDMINYLSSSKFEGIGRKTAKLIVDEFGDQTWDVIMNEPERLNTIKGLRLKKLEKISEAFKQTSKLRSFIKFLSPFGIGTDRLGKIADKFELKDIQKNPYLLYEEGMASFSECDRIGASLNYPADNPNRLDAAINYVLRDDMSSKGNMLMEYNSFERKLFKFLNQTVTKEQCQQAAVRMLSENRLAFIHGLICTVYSNNLEYFISRSLYARTQEKMAPGIVKAYEGAVKRTAENSDISLTENQKKAVLMALTNHVSVITGGPGTGKTTILKTIINAQKSADESLKNKERVIMGLAPTGKARSRMQDVTDIDCYTIHSALRLSPEDKPDQKMETNVVLDKNSLILVDEVSMVDSRLMKAVLEAVPLEAKVVFIGDVDQLASVGAGCVLQQMIDSNVIPVTRLTDVFRQAKNSTIIDNAYNVNNGILSMHADESFVWIPAYDQHEAMMDAVNSYCEESRINGRNETVILTPLKSKGEASSASINKAVQAAVNPAKKGDETITVGEVEFHVNDKVMQTKNVKIGDTEDMIANGDVGCITAIETKVTESKEKKTIVSISFDTGIDVEYDRHEMKNVTLAYAMTIHKSQGSEYKSVIIVLCASQQCQLFKRSLLYTALTRSTSKVILITDPAGAGVKQCTLTPGTGRISTLSERLKKQKMNKYI